MRWISCAVLVAGCGGSPAPDVTWNGAIDAADAAPESGPVAQTAVPAAEDAGSDSVDEVWATIDNTNYGNSPPKPPGPAPIPTYTAPPSVPDAAPSLPFGVCAPTCSSNDDCNNSCPRRSGVWCCTAGTCAPFGTSQCP